MGRDTCKYPGCDKETREKGEEEYPNSDKTASNGEPFVVSAFGAKFCSTKHELKYEHVREDARERRAEEKDRGIDKSNYPEYDGPPY